MSMDPTQRDALILHGIEDMQTRKAWLYDAARRDVNVFATLFNDENGKRIVQGAFHRGIQAHMTQNDSCILHAWPGAGKCQPPWSSILMDDGNRIPIVDVRGGDLVRSWDGEKFISMPAGQPFCDGLDRVLRIHTQSGRRIDVTANHPLMTWRGWQPAGRLQVKDRIAIPHAHVEGGKRIDIDIAWLLGLLIGDGGLSIEYRLNLTTADMRVLDNVKYIAGNHGWHVRKTEGYGYQITGPQRRGKMKSKARPNKFLIKDGWLERCTSHYKRVPRIIFESNNDIVRAFLAGYFDADGTADNRIVPVMEYYSVSRELLIDVQELLTRIGIQSRLKRKRGTYKKRLHLSWRLTISSDASRLAFMLPCKSSKIDIARDKTVRHQGNYDLVQRDAYRDLGVSEYFLNKKYKVSLSHHKTITRAWLLKAARMVENKEVESHALQPLWYDRIDKIEDLGEWPVYGLPVNKTHCYISEGILSHNSVQVAIRTLWELGRNPFLRIGMFSATSELSDKILGMMQNNIEMNEGMHRTFPHLQKSNFETWGERRIQIKGYRGTKKDYTVETAGIAKKIYGSRYDLAILDDIHDLQNSSTAGQRQKIVDWHDTMLLSRLMRGDREWIIGTPWNKYDAYHVLAERGIPLFKYPVEEGGVFLWPEQWDAARLAARKRKMTAWRYWQQYYMQDQSPDESPFDLKIIEDAYVPESHFRSPNMVPADWQFLTGVDLGIQKKKDSDRTVFVTLATDGVKKLVMDIRAGKWGLTEKKRIAEALHRQYGGVFVVEDNAAQLLMLEMLKDYTRVPVIGSTTKHGSKVNDEWGIPSLAIDVENGRWQIPAKPNAPLEVRELIDEMVMYNPASHTGDTLMACYLAYSGIARLFRGGITIRTASDKKEQNP